MLPGTSNKLLVVALCCCSFLFLSHPVSCHMRASSLSTRKSQKSVSGRSNSRRGSHSSSDRHSARSNSSSRRSNSISSSKHSRRKKRRPRRHDVCDEEFLCDSGRKYTLCNTITGEDVCVSRPGPLLVLGQHHCGPCDDPGDGGGNPTDPPPDMPCPREFDCKEGAELWGQVLCMLDKQDEVCAQNPQVLLDMGNHACGPCEGDPATEAPTNAPTDAPKTTAPTTDQTKAPTTAPTAAPTAAAPPASEFDITFQFDGVSAADQAIFTNAADRWSEIIVGDRPQGSLAGMQTATQCANPLPASVDDVHICAVFETIDGVGGVLGSAGPRVVTDENGIPRTLSGDMRFDTADIDRLRADGELQAVILHEMAHVLGIGTLWDSAGLIGAAPTCAYSANSAATREWQAISGCTDTVPIETDFGAGTACGHWDEECVQDEVMTGFLTGDTPISRITIGALEDLGYDVDYSKADPFTAGDLDPACSCVRRHRNLRRFLQNPDNNNGKKDAPPGLSKKAEKEAIQFGYSILANNLVIEYLDAPDNLSDKGQEFVIVFYYENGHVYSIRVTPDDL